MNKHPLDVCPVLEATRITRTTLLGVCTNEFPVRSGNCFSVATSLGHIAILNMALENLEELLRTGVVTWPLSVTVVDAGAVDQQSHGLVSDVRVPDDYLIERWCEVCCPQHLLPAPQRLRHLRSIARGTRTEHANGIVSIQVTPK